MLMAPSSSSSYSHFFFFFFIGFLFSFTAVYTHCVSVCVYVSLWRHSQQVTGLVFSFYFVSIMIRIVYIFFISWVFCSHHVRALQHGSCSFLLSFAFSLCWYIFYLLMESLIRCTQHFFVFMSSYGKWLYFFHSLFLFSSIKKMWKSKKNASFPYFEINGETNSLFKF